MEGGTSGSPGIWSDDSSSTGRGGWRVLEGRRPLVLEGTFSLRTIDEAVRLERYLKSSAGRRRLDSLQSAPLEGRVAELADALGSGPSGFTPVEVRFLSRPLQGGALKGGTGRPARPNEDRLFGRSGGRALRC